MSVIHVNKNNFKETVTTEKTVLLDFWAPWCGPCRMVSPIVDEIADENADLVFAVKLELPFVELAVRRNGNPADHGA